MKEYENPVFLDEHISDFNDDDERLVSPLKALSLLKHREVNTIIVENAKIPASFYLAQEKTLVMVSLNGITQHFLNKYGKGIRSICYIIQSRDRMTHDGKEKDPEQFIFDGSFFPFLEELVVIVKHGNLLIKNLKECSLLRKIKLEGFTEMITFSEDFCPEHFSYLEAISFNDSALFTRQTVRKKQPFLKTIDGRFLPHIKYINLTIRNAPVVFNYLDECHELVELHIDGKVRFPNILNLSKLKKLEILDIDLDEKYELLAIGEAINLSKLSIVENYNTPGLLQGVPYVHELTLAGHLQDNKFWEEIPPLKSLQKMQIKWPTHAIADSIDLSKFKKMVSFSCEDQHLLNMGEIRFPDQIQEISFWISHLHKLPDDIYSLKNLRTLNLVGTRLDTLSPDILNMNLDFVTEKYDGDRNKRKQGILIEGLEVDEIPDKVIKDPERLIAWLVERRK